MPGKKKGVHNDGTPFADPSKPAWATVNRLDGDKRNKAEVKLRLPHAVLDLVNEASGAFGRNQRNDWLTRAALELAKAQGFEVPPEVDSLVKAFDASELPEPKAEFDRFDPEYLARQLG